MDLLPMDAPPLESDAVIDGSVGAAVMADDPAVMSPLAEEVAARWSFLPQALFVLPGGIVLPAREYFALVIVLGVVTFGLGMILVDYLRFRSRTAKKVYLLAGVVFFTPFAVFLILNTLLLFGLAERMLCDSLSFCVAAGILFRLTNKPRGPNSIKVIAQETSGRSVDVWFDNMRMAVGDVRNKVAEALGVQPAARVSIESGKGAFIDDLSKSFTAIVDDALVTTDFFGFVTMNCFIVIAEEKRRPADEGSSERITVERRGSVGGQILTLLTKTEVRYAESLTLLGRTTGTASKTSFQVSYVDKFAAAAPGAPHLQLNAPTLRVHAWTGEFDHGGNNHLDNHSDQGDAISVSSGHRTAKSSPMVRMRKKPVDNKAGKAVCHGDIVVLEHGGRFMSVTRGWWMAWSSSEPRRSGAFTIEIIEKAPQNKLKEQLDVIKEKIRPGKEGAASSDSVLRAGDVFRLRSVKFPEYELGLTSIKIRDEYCYLGLRKILTPLDAAASDDNWCMEMRFTFKPQGLV